MRFPGLRLWWLQGQVWQSRWSWMALALLMSVRPLYEILGQLSRTPAVQPVMYALLACAIPIVLRSLACELVQFARCEALRLLPNFVVTLTRSVLLCVTLLSAIGAAISLILKNWLPLIATVYVASVAASLILPVSDARRAGAADLNHLKQLGADSLEWSAILLLFLPIPALGFAPERVVFGAMLVLATGLLLCLPRRLARIRAPAAPGGGAWREPSFAVFACALALAVGPSISWSHDSLPLLLYAVTPWVGLTGLGREAARLRGQRCLMWLSGMSRRRLCLVSMVRLAHALVQELAIYLIALLLGCAVGFGPNRMEHLQAAGFIIVWGLANGLRALDEALYGRPGRSWGFMLNDLWALAPATTLLVLAMMDRLLSGYGLFALIAALAGLAWVIASHCRCFETVEL